MNFEAARAQMLGQQIRAWEVLDDRVLRAIADTPREQFVPADYRDLAFADTEIPIGHGQLMLAPKIEGYGAGQNRYDNPFNAAIGLFKTSLGHVCRCS